METKVPIRIVKKGQDDGNLSYWLSLSEVERMVALEKTRQEVNLRLYGAEQGFQRVLRVIERSPKKQKHQLE
ncbi:MAG: hypothetical protein RIE59_10185 [Imperialibacter sp.]